MKSETSYDGVYDFYVSRINASRNYGLTSGDEILRVIMRTAFWDSMLTLKEFDSIINLCGEMHKKLMEDNFNAGWNE